MFVRHPVKDFAVWKKAYDDFDAERISLGVIGQAVFQDVDDSNDVTAWHDFTSIDVARAFAASERLRDVMSQAGVAGEPVVWFAMPAD
jgi:hypothetical protein